MYESNSRNTRRLRALALTASLLLVSAFALTANAGASPSLNIATDVNAAGEYTTLTLNTALSGSGNSTRQYGAGVTVPAGVWLEWSRLGTSAQRCPGSSFSSVSTGYSPPATAFSNANCPSTARVGTATLGSTSGGIYVVNGSPLPQFGLYFDTGVSEPYGRRLSLSYSGSSAVMSVQGLASASTTGLTLDFNNPSRPTLPAKIWMFASAGAEECTPEQQATGAVMTYPASGTVVDFAATSPATLSVTGCGVYFSLEADTDQADSVVGLSASTHLFGTGDDLRQYGVIFKVPRNVTPDGSTYGAANQRCPGGSITSGAVFDNTNCPPESVIGTAELGDATGKLYVVNSSPYPRIGLYFDSGVTPYGKAMSWSWDSEGAASLMVTGLHDDSTEGLKLVFNNPSRPSLPRSIWRSVEASHQDCESTDGTAKVYNYPLVGGLPTVTSEISTWLSIVNCDS